MPLFYKRGESPGRVFSFHSVVVSTLDFESNNTSSNLVGSSNLQLIKYVVMLLLSHI